MTEVPLKSLHLIEDDAAVRASIVAVLESWGFAVEAFTDGESYLAATGERPVCILLDVRLPGIDGLAVLNELRRSGRQVPVIMISAHGDVALAVKAIQCGAQDFVEKPFDDADLVNRIRAAIAHRAGEDYQAANLDILTKRELQVMREVVAGNANKVIAYNLGISPKTVEMHRARVMKKTGAKSLSQLVRIAMRSGTDPAEVSR